MHTLQAVSAHRGLHESIHCHSGNEFTPKEMDKYSYKNGVGLEFIQPGNPHRILTLSVSIEHFAMKFEFLCFH